MAVIAIASVAGTPTSGSNNATLLKLGPGRKGCGSWPSSPAAAWQVDPDLELVIGLAQPPGEYLAREEQTYSPFIFADTLIRAGLKCTCDVEWILGVSPRGLLLLAIVLSIANSPSLYAILGSAVASDHWLSNSTRCWDASADPESSVAAGHWQSGYPPRPASRLGRSLRRACHVQAVRPQRLLVAHPVGMVKNIIFRTAVYSTAAVRNPRSRRLMYVPRSNSICVEEIV